MKEDRASAQVLTSPAFNGWIEEVEGFPGGSVVKNPPTNAEDAGLILHPGRSPEEGNGYPLQYSCLGNPMDRGPWGEIVRHNLETDQQEWGGWMFKGDRKMAKENHSERPSHIYRRAVKLTCVPQNSCWKPNSKVILWGGGIFWRASSHDGISALARDPVPRHQRDTQSTRPPVTRKQALIGHQDAEVLILHCQPP